MLQAMRSKAAGLVVKILFSILVLSFAVWGIGDYTFLRHTDSTAVRIGDVKIPASTLDKQYRSELDRLRQTMGQIDPEMARQFGLVDQVIQRIVTQSLLDQAARRLGVRIGDDVLRSRLAADPEMQSPTGQFDRDRFQQLLYRNNLSEADFTALYRQDLARALLTEPLYTGVRPPEVLVDRLYRYRNEKRGGDSVFVPAASFTDVGTPDDAQIKATYDENHDRFTAPEYRNLTVARVSAEDVLPQISVTDQQIEDEYRARLPELRVPEKRDIEQLLFSDEAAAKAAYERLKAGGKLEDIAKENKQTPEQTRIGMVTQGELVPELTGPLYALPEGGFSEPLHSPFGWHILRVTKIVPGTEPPLAEIKDQVTKELKQRLATDAAYDYATKLEDAVANGASVEEAAAKIALPTVKVAAVDAQGRGPDGKPVAVLDGAAEALTAAFDTAEASDTPLTEVKDSAWYMVHVNSITPSALRPLADIRDQVTAVWQTKKREDAAKARAEQILAEVRGGKSLDAAAAPFGLKTNPAPPVIRSAGYNPRATVPPEINARLFSLKPNEAAVVPSRDGFSVVRLTQIVPADPASDAAGVEQLRTELRQQLGGDAVAGYVSTLRQHFGVTVDREAVDRVTGS